MTTKAGIKGAPTVDAKRPETTSGVTLVKDRRPFVWLEAIPAPSGLPFGARDGLPYLQYVAWDDDARIAQQVVEFSIRGRAGSGTPIRAPAMSVINRRRRAARLWINAILDGSVTASTLDTFATNWLPTLLGIGPERRPTIDSARDLVEYVRGCFTATIFAEPAGCLLRQAKALHALETVLSAHLAAVGEASRVAN